MHRYGHPDARVGTTGAATAPARDPGGAARGGPDERSHVVPVPRGYRVGRWEVREPLASGAFATVYEARDTGAGAGQGTGPEAEGAVPERVALKFLPTGTRTPRQLRHLRDLAEREIGLLSRVRSPRLIRMYEALTVDDPARPDLDGATVLVLEQAEDCLSAVLGRDPAPASGPALLAQVCEGLHQLHGAGWVHGDLKPGNVLLMADGTVRLADFSTAAELEGTHAYAPAFSTPDYTPPELLWPEAGPRGTLIRPTADIWAFGVLAHVVLTGSYPLPGATRAARCEAAVRYARGAEELRLSPALPEPWRAVVADCLARTHEERAAHGTAALLGRVREAAGVAVAPRRRVPFRRRHPLLASVCATLLVAAATTGTAGYAHVTREDGTPVYEALPKEERSPSPGPGGDPVYGFHRCPEDSVCFFSEHNGNGEMCSWRGDDADWLAGEETCGWAAGHPVRSVFHNVDKERKLNGLAYFRGADFRPAGADRRRRAQRTGCTTIGSMGNLAGTYAPRSHRLVDNCASVTPVLRALLPW